LILHNFIFIFNFDFGFGFYCFRPLSVNHYSKFHNYNKKNGNRHFFDSKTRKP